MAHKKEGPTRGWHTGRVVKEAIGPGRSALEQAGVELNTSSGTLYRWLLRAEWPDHLIDRMADYLGISPAWLKTGHGSKYTSEDGDLHMRMERILNRYMADMRRITKRYHQEIVQTVKDPTKNVRGPGETLSEAIGRK